MGNGLAKVRAVVGGGIGNGNSSGGNLKSHFGGMRKWKLAGMVMELRAVAPKLGGGGGGGYGVFGIRCYCCCYDRGLEERAVQMYPALFNGWRTRDRIGRVGSVSKERRTYRLKSQVVPEMTHYFRPWVLASQMWQGRAES